MPTVQSKLFMRSMLLVAYAVAALSQSPPPALVQLEAPGLTVISDAGAERARGLMDRILEMKQAFPIEYDAHLTLLVLSRDQRFARLRPSPTATGFFQRTSGGNYIVLADPGAIRVLRHEFVHFALDHAAVALPRWLEEGLAEYYSTLEVRRDYLLAGAPIEGHVLHLRERRALNLDNATELYPSGWALVHLLRNHPQYAPRFGAFWQRLAQGEPASRLLLEVFGRQSFRQIEDDVLAHLERPLYASDRIPYRGPLQALSRVETRTLTPDDFDQHYLDLARAMGRMEPLDQTIRAGRNSAATRAVAAAMKATMEKRVDDARRHWEHALTAGAQSGAIYFEYAGALRDAGAPESEIAAALRQVVERNPRFTPANLWLAAMEGRRGRWAEAEKLLLFAAAESPRRFDVWYELAFARREQGRGEAAREAAGKAVAVAVNRLDREKAEALRDAASASASASVPARPATIIKGWQADLGDRQVEADWVELVCEQPAVVRLSGGEEFLIRDPSKVTLKNTGSISFEFQCGKQEPARRIRLGYESATREVRLMEFLATP